ncbi:MAG: hypothetical protein LBM99_03670 [Bacillales bacterium]|jgi:hypothetical protein|nr:hypothetical protein [Bacillales bacterium]
MNSLFFVVIDDIWAYSIIGITIILVFVIERLKKIKNRKTTLARIISNLINENFTKVRPSKEKDYDISFMHGEKEYQIKVEQFGKRHSILLTNPHTIYKKKQKAPTVAPTTVIKLGHLCEFLQKEKVEKIVFIEKDALKRTKYVNENELEEIKPFEKTFKNVYIIYESEFIDFLKHLVKLGKEKNSEKKN